MCYLTVTELPTGLLGCTSKSSSVNSLQDDLNVKDALIDCNLTIYLKSMLIWNAIVDKNQHFNVIYTFEKVYVCLCMTVIQLSQFDSSLQPFNHWIVIAKCQ